MSAQILYTISANKKLAGKTHGIYLSVSELGKYIHIEAGKQKSSGLDGISNQLLMTSGHSFEH